ncbi:MAG TPA: DUF4383 domain-containing protein [Pyrinomonadaceae bacterium]|nr:DUF4383 domain-containing protein [Pyrinomonadaceae bacterium]
MIRTFALIFGIVYLLVGILGFIPGLVSHDTTMHDIAVDSFHGRLLGLFPVNILHNIVHIAIGLWGLLASRSVGGARLFGKGLAIIYGLLAILGLIPGANTMFGLVPIYGHDVWLHALSALIAAYFGWFAREDGNRTA